MHISYHFWTLKLHFLVWIAQSIALNYVQNLLQKSVDIIFNPKTYLIKSTRSSKSSHSLQSTYYQQSLKHNLHKIVFNCKVLSCSSCHEKRIKEIKFLFLICHEKTPEASSPYEIWIISQKHIFLFPLNVTAEQPFHGIIKMLNWSPSCNLQIIVNTEKSCFSKEKKLHFLDRQT